MTASFFVAAFAAVGFGILFHAPVRSYWVTGLFGGLSWVIYSQVLANGGGVGAACFSAAIALTLLSRLAAVLMGIPVIVYLVGGIVPLVPGTSIYYMAYSLVEGDLTVTATRGLETIVYAGTIALGILAAYLLPQKWFGLFAARVRSGLPGKRESGR